jgi:hypothetical protein
MKPMLPILFLVLNHFISPTTHAQDFNVYTRSAPGKGLIFTEKKLPNLLSDTTFSGVHFKIVEGTTHQAVSFDSDISTVAATVYYHLEEALAFAEADAENFPALKANLAELNFPITIRVGMENEYSSAAHWSTVKTTYNTSYTIPAGSHPELGSWGDEIWFFKSKKEKIPSATSQVLGIIASPQYRDSIFQQLSFTEMVKIGQKIAYAQDIYWPAHLLNITTSLVLTEGLLPAISAFSKLFSSHRMCETAMIPEAIVHEFGHLLFKKNLSLFAPSAIVEGYPNYFASRVADSPLLGQRLGKFSKNFAKKNGRSKMFYQLSQETGLAAATGNLTFSLLYQIEQKLGEEIGPQVIYGALKYLDRSSEISPDLTQALNTSVSENSPVPLRDSLLIREVLSAHGL